MPKSRSALLIEKTQARLEDIQRGIDGLRLKRKDVEITIEATIHSLRNTMEFVREQEAHDRDERVLIHRPRFADPASALAAPAIGGRQRLAAEYAGQRVGVEFERPGVLVAGEDFDLPHVGSVDFGVVIFGPQRNIFFRHRNIKIGRDLEHPLPAAVRRCAARGTAWSAGRNR